MSSGFTPLIDIAPTYATRELPLENKLHPVLKAAIRAKGVMSQKTDSREPYWSAEHFGLNRTRAFQRLTAEKQKNVLKLASQQLLEEAYFIEKSGMSFTAKMSLLSETTQERMLYGLFASDETLHLQYVSSHLSTNPESRPLPPFVKFLSEIIQQGDRASLIFLIQVVLEGWGITHYHELAENSLNEEVKQSLRLILKDEARHHGSGMIMIRSQELSLKQKNYIRETMVEFMRMVQCGPQNLVSAVESETGVLSAAESKELFEDLRCVETTQDKIQTLRGLLAQVGAADLIENLDQKGVMRPWNASQCAELRNSL
jgi:rubrerythrin